MTRVFQSAGFLASLVFASLAIGVSPAAADATAAPQKVASIEGITEYHFANGLRLLLYPDASQSKFSVNLTVLVGSRQEGYGETGMAHLLEHMVFKGTPRHPQVPRALQEHGATFNGSTSSDRVNYFETLAATDENLEFAIDLEADRLMNSFIRREDLDSEMTVVRNEFERGENSLGRVLSQRIESVAYDWHNYGKPTIGNRSDIERVPIENLQAFYKKYYQPDNVILIVAGKFEEPKALALVQSYFGAIPRPLRTLPQTWTDEPAQDGERSVTLRRVDDLPMVAVAYHTPSGAHEDAAALQVLGSILTTQPSGRLFKALVETKKAASAGAFASRDHDPGLFMAQATLARDGALDDVRDTLLATLEDFARGDVTAEEVARAKQQILKQRELAAADTAQIGISLSEWAAQGDWRLYFLHRDRIEQVTPAAVKAVAARYLRRSNRTLGLFIPAEQPERVTIPGTPDLAPVFANYQGRAAMVAGEAFDPAPANIESRVQRTDAADGMKLTLLPKKSRGQEVHVTLALRYGDEQSLKGMENAAAFLPELMLRGTKQLTYQQLRDELDRLGATLTTGNAAAAGRGRRNTGGFTPTLPGLATFSIQAKRDTLAAVLELLRQVLREPALPADYFELVKRERLAALEQTRTDPASLAPRQLHRQLTPYAKDDIRYTPTVDEAIARLRTTDYARVAQLYRDYLGSVGELTIVGDFDAEACLPILRATFAGWKAPQPFARIAQPLMGGIVGSHEVINTPDKANATYVAGLTLPVRDDDPDYPALLLGNYILGSGTLSSRLGVRIRQQEGLSYGVSSSFTASALDRRAALTITAICNPQNMPRLETCVREEVDRLVREGVTADELAKARRGYLEALKVARSSDSAIATVLTNLRYFGRTMQWQAELERKLEALTAAEVSAALRRHVSAAQLVVVTAGDLATKPAGE